MAWRGRGRIGERENWNLTSIIKQIILLLMKMQVKFCRAFPPPSPQVICARRKGHLWRRADARPLVIVRKTPSAATARQFLGLFRRHLWAKVIATLRPRDAFLDSTSSLDKMSSMMLGPRHTHARRDCKTAAGSRRSGPALRVALACATSIVGRSSVPAPGGMQKGTRCARVVRTSRNAVAAPATVSGEPSSMNHWSMLREGRGWR
jgi:hypothetical protein